MKSKKSTPKGKSFTKNSAGTKKTPPDRNQIELSLFGPGVGECLVVHLGQGDWMIVDSCPGNDGTTPVALEYLELLGVDVASQVKRVVATHWHDDHIRGLTKMMELAQSARFVCSSALNNPGFISLIASDSNIKLVSHISGVSEFAGILSILKNRKRIKNAAGPDHYASEGMILYPGTSSSNTKVYALSPSAATTTQTLGYFAQQLPKSGNPINKIAPIKPNHTSVVLILETETVHLLLGADLETVSDDSRGWRAVVHSQVRPQLKSSGYKVAHHGSKNADLELIWTELLHPNPIAVLTPYACGRRPLPSLDDVQRLKGYSSKVYCTIWPANQRPAQRGIVERTINEVAKNRRMIAKQPGHIRLRYLGSGESDQVQVELFNGARIL